MATVTTNGIRAHVEDTGDGPALLFLPGTGQRLETLQIQVIPALVAAGFRVVVAAPRGIPPTECPPGPYTVSQLAVDAAGVIEFLGIGRCHVAGYSLGGFIAEELCYTRPELVDRVCLIASSGRASSFTRLAAQSILDLATSGHETPRSLSLRDGLIFLLPVSTMQDNDAAIDATIAALGAAPEWVGPGRAGQWAADVAWIDDPDRHRRWSALNHRALVIAFENDLFWPPSRSREAADAMAAEFVQVDGAAHGGLLTHGAAVIDHLVTFLRAP
jgi:pimeloyl-ACP methyl ester carboxylesterase